MVISINKAEYINGYKINISFSDGTEQLIDFYHFLSTARNQMTSKYIDIQLFKNFSIVYGDIVWNDFEMYFPIWDLHEGQI